MAHMPTASQIDYMKQHAEDDRRTEIIIANVICITVAYIAVFARFYSRRIIRASIQADDWLIVAGLVIYTGFIICFSMSTRYGAGRHAIFVTDLHALAVANIADENLYGFAIAFIKFSQLCLYSRIFPQRRFQLYLALLGTFITGWALATSFSSIFQCVPIAVRWNTSLPGRCIEYGKFAIAIGIINIVTDFIILGLPMPLVWRIQTTTTNKILLTVVFLLGGCACIVSIIRLAFVGRLDSSSDPSWEDIPSGVLSTVEICVGIIAVCIATWRPLFNRLLRRSTMPIDTSRKIAGKPRGDQVSQIELASQISIGSDDQQRLYTRMPDQEPPFENLDLKRGGVPGP